MAGKIGVYFDLQNIGGGLDVEALAAQTRDKWGDLTPVVKVVPLLAEAVEEIKADIEAQGLDGVLLCGASPRVDGDLYRFPVQVEHVNLREQCVLAYKNPDNSPVDSAEGAPELLTLMARDYVNMGVVKLQKSEVPDSAAIPGVARILVIGGGWTGLTAAAEAAATGYEVVLVEKAEKLGGAVNNIPTASPLGPLWTDKQPTNLAAKIEKVTADDKITVHLNARMEKLEGQPGEFTAVIATAGGPVSVEVGAVVLASGWVPLDENTWPHGPGREPQGGACCPVRQNAGGRRSDGPAHRLVLDTTLAEEAVRKAAEEAPEAPAEAEAAKPAPAGEEGGEKPFVKEDLESVKHLQYSNAVNSVGMLRLANTICEKTDDATQAFILYKDMTVPGILERFYKKMQDRLGVMMTKADVTESGITATAWWWPAKTPCWAWISTWTWTWWFCPRAWCPPRPRT